MRNLLFALLLLSASCHKGDVDINSSVSAPVSPEVQAMRDAAKALSAKPEEDIDDIQVQHILISYKDGGIPGVKRNLDQAEVLAAEVWAKVNAGEDFDALVKKYTNDQYPGIYGMTQRGAGDQANNIFSRKDMVPAFGEVGFRLKVGEVGVALFHPQKSPYGYHIVKRVK